MISSPLDYSCASLPRPNPRCVSGTHVGLFMSQTNIYANRSLDLAVPSSRRWIFISNQSLWCSASSGLSETYWDSFCSLTPCYLVPWSSLDGPPTSLLPNETPWTNAMLQFGHCTQLFKCIWTRIAIFCKPVIFLFVHCWNKISSCLLNQYLTLGYKRRRSDGSDCGFYRLKLNSITRPDVFPVGLWHFQCYTSGSVGTI